MEILSYFITGYSLLALIFCSTMVFIARDLNATLQLQGLSDRTDQKATDSEILKNCWNIEFQVNDKFDKVVSMFRPFSAENLRDALSAAEVLATALSTGEYDFTVVAAFETYGYEPKPVWSI